MSKRDLSPVSEIGPLLEQNLDSDPQDDGNLASRQIEANSRQNSTETSRYSISDADVFGESESDTVRDAMAAVGTLQHDQDTRAEGDGPPISGEDSADSGTAKINTTKIKRQSSYKEYVVTSGLECNTDVGIPPRFQQQIPEVVWITHSNRTMKITDTDVTMVPQSNPECNLNRITFEPCKQPCTPPPTPPDDDVAPTQDTVCVESPLGLDHVVFKKATTGATTEKTLAITQDTVGVGDASGLDGRVTPEKDAYGRFFRLRYPSPGKGAEVLLELCKHHKQFLAYDGGDRLQVLPYAGDVAKAGTKFRFQIVSPDSSDSDSDDSG